MASKACCSFPGRSIESCDRRIANSTTMIRATSTSIDADADQGRSIAGWPIRPRAALASDARWSLNRAVSQGSCSGINKFDENFQNDGGGRHEQADQTGRQTDFGKPQYSIRAQSQEQIAKAQEDSHAGAGRLAGGRLTKRVDGSLQPAQIG